jgi:hypothetical protein
MRLQKPPRLVHFLIVSPRVFCDFPAFFPCFSHPNISPIMARHFSTDSPETVSWTGRERTPIGSHKRAMEKQTAGPKSPSRDRQNGISHVTIPDIPPPWRLLHLVKPHWLGCYHANPGGLQLSSGSVAQIKQLRESWPPGLSHYSSGVF